MSSAWPNPGGVAPIFAVPGIGGPPRFLPRSGLVFSFWADDAASGHNATDDSRKRARSEADGAVESSCQTLAPAKSLLYAKFEGTKASGGVGLRKGFK